MEISGNTILITGGTSGIGLELAKQFLLRKNTVIVTGRDRDRLNSALANHPGLVGVQSDASDPDAIVRLHDELVKRFPALNMLINNAGVMRKIDLQGAASDLHGLTEEIDINLNAPIRMTAQFLPHLTQQPYAAIVNVSSGVAFFPLPLSPVYCAAKAAIHSFTLSLRIQLKRSKVNVFELAPPMTATPLVHTFDPEDIKGIPVMDVEKLARLAVDGIRKDRLEIRPGMSNVMKLLGRMTSTRLLGIMLGSTVDRMLDRH